MPKAPPKPIATPPGVRPLNMGVMFRMGSRYLVRHKGVVLAYILLFLLVQTLIPLGIASNAGRLTNDLQIRPPAPESVAPDSKPAARLAGISHRRLITTYGFWVGLTVMLVAATFGQRYVTSALAGKVGNDIRKDLFRSLLDRPAQFFHKHDSDQLTMIVNQFSMQVQSALQSLLIDPVLNIIGMIVLGISLYRGLAGGARETGSQLWIFFRDCSDRSDLSVAGFPDGPQAPTELAQSAAAKPARSIPSRRSVESTGRNSSDAGRANLRSQARCGARRVVTKPIASDDDDRTIERRKSAAGRLCFSRIAWNGSVCVGKRHQRHQWRGRYYFVHSYAAIHGSCARSLRVLHHSQFELAGGGHG